ncbi:hypothetical protein Tco_1174439 [Tanacetum coccineum]
MNEQVADASKKRVKKDDSIKGEIKEEEGTRKRKIELAILEQISTGKGIPNPLMAGRLPKTIKPTELDVAVLLKRQVANEDG